MLSQTHRPMVLREIGALQQGEYIVVPSEQPRTLPAVMDRIGGSLAAHLLAVRNGAAIIRTHDVPETIQAIKVDNALRAIK